MDNTAATHSTLDTLRTVEFRLGLKGYNVDEVDEYLEKAAIEAEQLKERLRVANERLRQATDRISQLEAEPQRPAPARAAPPEPPVTAAAAPSPSAADDSLQRTLLLAQKFVDQAKRESEAEAAETLQRAEERARALVGQAEERARQISTESERRLRDDVVRLEALRTRLSSDVEAMTARLEEQRSKIRASLSEALKWVDDLLQPVPAGAGPSARPAAVDAGSPADPRRPVGPAGGAPDPSGRAATGSSTAVSGTGSLQPSGGAADEHQGAPEHPPSPGQPADDSEPASERGQTPVGVAAGPLNGGLFEVGRVGSNGHEAGGPPQ